MVLSEIKPDHRLDDELEHQKIDSALFLDAFAPQDGLTHWEDQDMAIQFDSNNPSHGRLPLLDH